MIDGGFVSGRLVAVVLVPTIIAIGIVGSRERRGAWWAVLRVAIATYAATLLALTLFPFPIPPWGPNPGFMPWIMPIPFQTILISLDGDWADPAKQLLVGNIVAFLPLGVFVGLHSQRDHAWRRAIVAGATVSFAIEACQLGFSLLIGYPYRQADVDDVILNTFGTFLGYGLFWVADTAGRRFLPARAIFWAGISARIRDGGTPPSDRA